ncbi:MAG: high-potential iron-sulfur protein [Deltaproteobacteria bacterium]|nr:high-potential iron-sulfur protein [Deltaproteobacteria bacterium]
MSNPDTVSRRDFIGFGIAALAASPLAASLLSACAGPAQQGVPTTKVDENDPIAKAIGFKNDAATVDTARFPKRAGEGGARQFCYSCSLYLGKPEAEFAACTMFPGKAVPRGGWCNAWAPRPS